MKRGRGYNDYCISLDVDWAPDWCIEEIAGVLDEEKVKATWFVTHLTPAIKKFIFSNSLFEVGIHPNFFPGSTQGSTVDEIMANLKGIAPQAVSVRTHGLFQSSPLLRTMREQYKILFDCSLFLLMSENLAPHEIFFSDSGKGLIRIPCFWDDDLGMYEMHPRHTLNDPRFNVQGLKVLDFHPIHILLNSENMHAYEKCKKIKKDIAALQRKEIEHLINKRQGTRTFFQAIVKKLSDNKSSRTISEVGLAWKKSRGNQR